jgi:hypothetical protein
MSDRAYQRIAENKRNRATSLDPRHCRLTRVPNTLSEHTQLHTLHLSHNSLHNSLKENTGSEIDFFGWFKAKQGQAQQLTDQPKPSTLTTVTVIGFVQINNRPARQDQIRYVSVKDNSDGSQVSLNGNRFRIPNVSIPKDRIIVIEVVLASGESVSQQRNAPQPNGNEVIDLGELLLTVEPSKPARLSPPRRAAGSPTIIINNQNVQRD